MPQPENMQQYKKITAYLEIVREQIRWKRAHAPVLQEIENHIADQKDALLSEGFDDQTATDRAIAEMGDPVVVGQQLDRTHRPRPDWPLLLMTAALLFLGLFFQFLIGPDIHNGTEMFTKQVIWAGLGILVMLAAYFLDFTIMGKYPQCIFWALCVLTAADYLLISNGSGRATTVHLLLLFPTAFAGLVYNMRNKEYKGLILCGAALLVPACLALLLPKITVLFLLCLSFLVILTAAVVKGWFNVQKRIALFLMYIPAVAVVIALPLGMIISGNGYVGRRLLAAFNPEIAPFSEGYLGTLIRQFLSHSRFIGEGLPLRDYGQLPSEQLMPSTNMDFFLTFLAYRFGWLLLLAIISLLIAFVVRAFLLCRRQKSVLGFLVSLAVILTFAVQGMTYIASNFGFLLFAPLTLPLFSYGGSGLLTNMFLIGLLLSVFRTGNLAGDRVEEVAPGKGRFIQYENGKIIINFRTNSIE